MTRAAVRITVAAAICALVAQWPASPSAAAAGDLTVTVKYTGKGAVDKSHQIWIWVFDNPNINPGAIPIAEKSVDANGGAAAFTALAADKVWIAVAYDINGGFTGSAPPPAGSPVVIHSDKAGAPLAVATGAKAKLLVTFDDTQKMQ